jgi:hypothetical protein
MTLPMMENFKDKVRNQFTVVKNIRERLIASDSAGFDVDTASTAAELMTKFDGFVIDGKRLSKVSEGPNELIFQLTP